MSSPDDAVFLIFLNDYLVNGDISTHIKSFNFDSNLTKPKICIIWLFSELCHPWP